MISAQTAQFKLFELDLVERWDPEKFFEQWIKE